MRINEIKLKRKNESPVIQDNETNDVRYFTFPILEKETWIVHGFSTRSGGVSDGDCATMNLSFSRGDDPENVLENYRRIAAAIGFDDRTIVCSDQTHTTNVRVVTLRDQGKGYLKPKDYSDIDALVTNDASVTLATFYADCVPLYFVDPVHRAIGLAHSGWKGTVNNIAEKTLQTMQEQFGTDPADVLAAVGPSICQDCYEVSEDVIAQFRQAYPENLWPYLFENGREEGKYQLNLWEACRQNMLRAGMLPEHIEITDVCTCCNPEVLFSHRASHGKRGNLAAFLGIKA